jgi:hypothetical protein
VTRAKNEKPAVGGLEKKTGEKRAKALRNNKQKKNTQKEREKKRKGKGEDNIFFKKKERAFGMKGGSEQI